MRHLAPIRSVLPIGTALIAMLVPARSSAQVATTEIAATVRRLATEPIEDGRVAGMSIAVVRGGDTLVMAGYGSADLELDVPTPDRAVYEIGSVTKQFTAAAVLLLQEEGKLSLDDDLTDWLPDYPAGGRAISIRRLLDHTSGIKGYTEMAAFREIATRDLPRDSLVALVAAEPFDFEPGGALIYNNSAYFLLGLIIEKASGASYEDFVESRLFEASGMADSRYCHKDELIPRRAKGYQPSAQGLRPSDYLNHLWPYAAGSLCSTVRDLAKWNQALHGDGNGGSLLSSESYREMVTPGTLNDGSPLRYAMGLTVTQRDGAPRIAHGGGIFGYVSDLRYLPEQDLSIAVLINTAGRASPSEIAGEIEDAVLGSVAPIRERTFAGDLERYTGTFAGPARGRRLRVTVSIAEDGSLAIQTGGGEGQSLTWLGGDTFARGQARYSFKREGERVVALHVDQVSGYYVLERSR